MRTRPVLPIYVLCDYSSSMLDHVDTLNDSLLELHRACRRDPCITQRARFCLIGFSESPQILLPLGKPGRLSTKPGGIAGASSNFGPTFIFLREMITRDVAVLLRQTHEVCRPAVFFLSDGQPTDPATWPAAYDKLVDPAWAARPNVVAVGIGDADPVTINQIGTFRTLLGKDRTSPGTALRQLASAAPLMPDAT